MRFVIETPHVKALCRDSTAWVLPLTAYPSVREAWMAGRAFWEGRDAWGAVVVVKLADIVGLAVWDEARIAIAEDEGAEERRRELLDGDG